MTPSIPLQNLGTESLHSDTHANPAGVKQGLINKYNDKISTNTTRFQNLEVLGANSSALGKVLMAEINLHLAYVDRIRNTSVDEIGSKQGTSNPLSKMWATAIKHLDCFKPADTETEKLKQDKQEIKSLLKTDAAYDKAGKEIEKAFSTPLATIDNAVALKTAVKQLEEKSMEQYINIASTPLPTPSDLRFTPIQHEILKMTGASHANSTNEVSAEEKASEYVELAASFRQENSKGNTPASSGSATPLDNYKNTMTTLRRTRTELEQELAKIAAQPLKPD